MKKICEYCLREVECIYKERIKDIKYHNKIIKFIEKYYICCECNNIFYNELYDDNILRVNDEIRKITGLIRAVDINKILDKYNIGQKSLSLILGIDETTFARYLDGQNPTRYDSELLKNILNNPWYYEELLIINKYKISFFEYNKSLECTRIEIIRNLI